MTPRAPVPHVCHPNLARRPRTRLGRLAEQAAAALLWPVALLGAAVAALGSKLFMPGVVTETFTVPAGGTTVQTLGSTFFLVALFERGDTTKPIVAHSMAELVALTGDRVTYGNGWDQARIYFAEGGTRLVAARLVGASATKGTLTLQDRDDPADDTLTITALDPGAHSARIKIAVTDGVPADTFTVVVYYDDVEVERFPDLTSPSEAVTALGTSAWVRAADESSEADAPDNNPAVLAATALSAGSDDRGTLVAADYVTALARFTKDYGPGIVAIPGFDSSQVGSGLIAHAQANDRLAALATTQTATPAQAKTAAEAFHSTAGAEHAGLFYPWVKVTDGAGGVRTVSPEGYVAGVRARAHATVGPWRAPAGAIATARFVGQHGVNGHSGVARELTQTEGDDLNANKVSAIRTIAGTTRLYGWRSLSPNVANYRLLTGRDTLNEIVGQGELRLERLVFETIDSLGHLHRELEAEMAAVVEPMRNAGGLVPLVNATGQETSAAYEIDAGVTTNADEVGVDVSVRPAGSAETIRLRITKVAVTAAM